MPDVDQAADPNQSPGKQREPRGEEDRGVGQNQDEMPTDGDGEVETQQREVYTSQKFATTDRIEIT